MTITPDGQGLAVSPPRSSSTTTSPSDAGRAAVTLMDDVRARRERDRRVAVEPAVVGQHVRRIDDRTGRYTTWAEITMMVPSPAGQCWLVSFIDGDVDVWRIDDADAHYQFRPNSPTPDGI